MLRTDATLFVVPSNRGEIFCGNFLNDLCFFYSNHTLRLIYIAEPFIKFNFLLFMISSMFVLVVN